MVYNVFVCSEFRFADLPISLTSQFSILNVALQKKQSISNQFFKSLFNSYICVYNNQTFGLVGPLLSSTKTGTRNLIFRQRQSFIFRAAIAHLYLSATLLIHHVSFSVIPSARSNLLTIQLSKAAVASVRHPNDFSPDRGL